MSITDSAQSRYAAKAFDPNKKLTDEQIEALKTVLRLSPSSINYQPWHFLLVTSDKAKADIASACPGPLTYNATKIKDAALMVVLCAKTEADSPHVVRVIEQEAEDQRYANEQVKAERLALVSGYIERLNEKPHSEVQAWLDKQCYIALGNVLLAAADMGIDSVPIEGFDATVVDEIFDLPSKGLHAVVLAGFGYHSDADFNATLAKSRLKDEYLFTEYE